MNVKQRLIRALLNLKDAKAGGGGSEIAIQCPRCHQYHINKPPHLYIEIDNDDLMRFDCKHCEFHGILTPGVLEELGIDNLEFKEYLLSLNKTTLKKIKTDSEKCISRKIPTLIRKSDTYKLDYVIERTGIDFYDKKNIESHKLIINFSDFLRLNEITLDLKEKYINFLSNNAIGFLSYDNNMINFRNLKESNYGTRYSNVIINKNIKHSFLYIPPLELDLLTKYPSLVLAEGVYDILCVKKKFYQKDATNILFAATGGKGSYKRSILKLLQISCFFGADITIFSDSDMKLEDYKKQFNFSISEFAKIRILYNKHKDWGEIYNDYEIKPFRL
jgi:hypothetical protein